MKALLVFLALLIACVVCGQPAIEIRKSRIRELDFLIGTWSVESKASDIAGDGTSRSGTMTWKYDMDSTVIRNERLLMRGPATGRFANWPVRGEFYEYILFNSSRNMFEMIAFEYGAASPARYWLVDTGKKLIQYRFAGYDASRGVTIETVVTMKRISDTELLETFEGFVFETGRRDWINTIVLKRL
jgi:hypothetical protein